MVKFIYFKIGEFQTSLVHISWIAVEAIIEYHIEWCSFWSSYIFSPILPSFTTVTPPFVPCLSPLEWKLPRISNYIHVIYSVCHGTYGLFQKWWGNICWLTYICDDLIKHHGSLKVLAKGMVTHKNLQINY